VIHEGKQKVFYVKMLRVLYRMLFSSVLYYKKFRKDIELIGSGVNLYDICVANPKVKGKQHTVTWHVDNLKSSHVVARVNDDFHTWCEKLYGNDELGHVKVVCGKIHNYLAMILDVSIPGTMKLDMRYYIKQMIEDFPYKIKTMKTNPWTKKLFKVDRESKHLDNGMRTIFHTFVMKAM
jgi:hypothetical protein